MPRSLRRKLQKLFRKPVIEIEPDEIFLDSSNLPDFDRNQFEGRIEKPIGKGTVLKLSTIFTIIFIAVIWQTWNLQAVHGEAYAIQSEINRLRHGLIFSERGIMYDRNGIELSWNIPSEEDGFARRKYIDGEGFSHILGYVTYPQKDAKGIFYEQDYKGIEGAELQFDDFLQGENGLKIIETNARGEITSESVVRPPRDGNNLTLSIDSKVQNELHSIIGDVAETSGFRGGAAIIMNIQNGEVIAMTSYPEYDSNILADGEPEEAINDFFTDERTPFLNRAMTGLFTPGSIIKPFVALGALNEGVIDPNKEILSTGVLTIPNPFNADAVSSFRDWKAHGYVDMRDAIAVSSNVYFYTVGGGYGDQEGIGIDNINRYVKMFGISRPTGIDLPSEGAGTIPNPTWKEQNFPGDIWRVGDTYHTSIGQYGFQVTPLQMVRAIGGLARDGVLVRPTVVKGKQVEETQVPIESEKFKVIQEGMRQTVTSGTGVALNFKDVQFAAKTGTAEVGARNEYTNSWITGYFPYENPQYAFIFLMEKAKAGTLVGSVSVAQRAFTWMIEETPEYFGLPPKVEDKEE